MVEDTAVKIVNKCIFDAYSANASDIHIEPYDQKSIVRLRIDGLLSEVGGFDKKLHEGVIARLKVLSALRTDLRLLPQDGRFKIEISGNPIDARISIVPTYYGEKCVIRLLSRNTKIISLEDLGFLDENKKTIEDALKYSHGMFLVVGPTGSGKTTTLYSLLEIISSSENSVITLEDPIEYSIKGITQIPVHGKGGFTFATALRSIVRQDPDVVMVGEIRDSETAKIATHISLTGHMLFSTLHTNDALTAVPRLIDMGVENFLLNSTLRLVIAQRLVRKICKNCVQKRNSTDTEKKIFDRHKVEVKEICFGKGCLNCRNLGFLGRISINEILAFGENAKNTDSMFRDGLKKVSKGITSLSEVISAVNV